jgi:ribosomal protein L35
MKLKTRKAALKRVKPKKRVLARKSAYRGHLLRRKNAKQLRRLKEPVQIHSSDRAAFSFMLPYA